MEYHPYNRQPELLRYCAKRKIVVEAYGVMGAEGLLADPVIQELAQKYNRSPAQITLRHSLQLGNVVLSKSVTPKRISENAQLFDFELAPADMEALAALNRDERTYWDNTQVP